MNEYFMNLNLDNTDRAILKCLQSEGRMSNVEVAEAVNVSPATCHRRIQRLHEEGAISAIRAEVNPLAVDRSAMILVGVVLEQSTPESFHEFENSIVEFSFVLDCHCVAGDFDYILKIRAKDISDFNRLHREQLLTLPKVRQLRSFFVLKEVVDNAPLDF